MAKLYPRGCGPCLGFAVADDNRGNQLWLIHNSTEGDGESVSEFTALVNRSRNLGVDVGGETAWVEEPAIKFLRPALSRLY